MTRPPTPKQALIAHMQELHPVQASRPYFARASLKVLQFAHHEAHRRGPCDHHHGVTTGANDRPIGWITGEGAIAGVMGDVTA